MSPATLIEGNTFWVTVLIDGCLLINLFITLAAYTMTSDPSRVVRWARRRQRGKTWYEEHESSHTALYVVRLWGRSLWLLLGIWGILTGFLIGLHWQGFFLRPFGF